MSRTIDDEPSTVDNNLVVAVVNSEDRALRKRRRAKENDRLQDKLGEAYKPQSLKRVSKPKSYKT